MALVMDLFICLFVKRRIPRNRYVALFLLCVFYFILYIYQPHVFMVLLLGFVGISLVIGVANIVLANILKKPMAIIRIPINNPISWMLYRVQIIDKEYFIFTKGLFKSFYNQEIGVVVQDEEDRDNIKNMLIIIVDYIGKSEHNILQNQTMNWGIWLIKFIEHDDGVLHIYEYDENSKNEYSEGVERSVVYWADQNCTCIQYGSEYVDPMFHHTVAVTSGVMEGQPIEAFRQKMDGDFSGWFIITKDYITSSDHEYIDIQNFKTYHINHVVDIQPRLVKYLSLQPGFRVNLIGEEDVVVFDPRLLEDE